MNSEKAKFYSVQIKNRSSLIHSVNQQTFVEDWQCARHGFEFFREMQKIKLTRKKILSHCLDKTYIYGNHEKI